MISRDDIHPAQPRDFARNQSADAGRDARPANSDSRLVIMLMPIISLLAASFLMVGIWKEWSEAPDGLLQRLAVASAMFFLTLRLTVGHFRWARRRIHLTASVAALGAIVYPSIAIWSAKDPWPTNYVALAMVMVGFFYNSRTWFWFTTITLCASWAAAAWPLLAGEQAVGVITVMVVGFFCSLAILEVRLRRLSRFEKETIAAPAKLRNEPAAAATMASSSADPASQPWCPVCKSARDAIIRHDGENIIDANPSATKLLGMSVTELSVLPLVGIFAPEKRESLAPILRLGNFEPFETIAAGFKDECIPVEVLNGGLALQSNGVRALLLRDVREHEKIRQSAASANRRAQQSALRIRELSLLASRGHQGEVEQYLTSLVKGAHRWLPCSIGCFVVLWDNEVQGFSVLATSAQLALQTGEISLEAADKGIIGWLAENAEPLVVHNVGAEKDRFHVRRLYSHEPVNAFCALPLMNSAGLMGFLLALERSHREFSAEDVDYLTLVAHCVASSCNEAMLQAQIQN
jgi:hypothetical protein